MTDDQQKPVPVSDLLSELCARLGTDPAHVVHLSVHRGAVYVQATVPTVPLSKDLPGQRIYVDPVDGADEVRVHDVDWRPGDDPQHSGGQ